jgi:hypothetical protein
VTDEEILSERTRIKELINELNTQITHLLILLYELDQEAATETKETRPGA